MKKFKTASIHSKIFHNMSLVSIGFILILFISISIIFFQRFFQLETGSSILQLEYISAQLDSYLTSVSNFTKTIIVNERVQENVTKYNKDPKSFSGIDLMNIKMNINHTIQSTPFIHSVILYAPDWSQIASTEMYSVNSSLSLTSLTNDGQWITRNKYSNTNSKEIIRVLSFIRPFYSYASGSALGYLEISIPEQTISNIYAEASNSYNHIFITNHTGRVESSNDTMILGEKYSRFDQIVKPGQSSYQFTANSIIFYKYFPELNWYILNEIALSMFLRPTFNALAFSVFMVILSIWACLLVSHKISLTITSPLYQLIKHTAKIKEGEWTPVKSSYYDSDIGLLFEKFNSMIEAQEKLKNDLLEAQKIKTQISLDLLQQQVNPHFLYNTLDNICSLAEIDEKETLIDLVMNLSAFYREGLSNGRFYITIREELDLTRAYLHIMQIRYYHKFEFVINCEESLKGCSCLKLLLQPIVENSIYHGIKELDRTGFLEINVNEKEDSIQFKVRDNGVGITTETIEKIWVTNNDHFGLKNIHQRVQLYYGDEYGLTIGAPEDGGCYTVITIGKQEALTNAN